MQPWAFPVSEGTSLSKFKRDGQQHLIKERPFKFPFSLKFWMTVVLTVGQCYPRPFCNLIMINCDVISDVKFLQRLY